MVISKEFQQAVLVKFKNFFKNIFHGTKMIYQSEIPLVGPNLVCISNFEKQKKETFIELVLNQTKLKKFKYFIYENFILI